MISEINFRDLFDLATDCMLILGPDECVKEINHIGHEQLGYTKAEMIGKHISQFISPEYVSMIGVRMAELSEKGHLTFESAQVSKNGSVLPVEISSKKIELDGQNAFFSVIRDIGERKITEKALKAREERFQTLFDRASEGILIVSPIGELIAANESFAKMHGFTPQEMQTMNLHDLDPPESAKLIPERMRRLLSGESLTFEVENYRKDGSIFPLEVSASLIQVDGEPVVQSFVRDISELRQAQLELQKARESKHRDILVKEVHHRIKNNLQGIIGVLRRHSEIHPEITKPINQAIGQVQSVAVIHGLQGRTGMSKVRLCELTYAIASGKEALWNKSIAVDIPSNWSPFVIIETEAVPTALILNELIANALKHSADGIVSISLHNGLDTDSVVVTIHNSGLIPAGFGLNSSALLGTGLKLVSSLMPQSGARLYWVQNKEQVVTKYELHSPIIHPDLSDYANIDNQHPQQ
jgi:PAS domain S-box-containing protein